MNNKQIHPLIGEVYMMKFSGTGSVQNGMRPGIIIQNNVGNRYSPNVIAIPLTTSLKKIDQPTHVLIKSSDSELKRDSMAICENPECIPKEDIAYYITTLNNEYMSKIGVAHLIATSVISYIDKEALMKICEIAVAMNRVR